MINFFTQVSFKNNRNIPSDSSKQNPHVNPNEFGCDLFSAAFERDKSEINSNSHKNISPQCVHYTYFFRNVETLNFVADYIEENFKNGTNIADFGCSYGQEAYTLAMLIKKHNSDKKYKITGYDIQPDTIKIAQKGHYKLGGYGHEIFLLDQTADSNDLIGNLKQLFNESFNQASTNNFDTRVNDVYTLKPDVFDGVVDFKHGDISDIGHNLNLDHNTGVVIFKNAWYHLTGYVKYIDPKNVNFTIVDDVTREINKSLPENGLLVVGQLARDHIYDIDKPVRKIVQNEKIINVYDSSPFHDILIKNGFVPVFYEKSDVREGAYLPSVWKKTNSVSKF
ncbi:MAG: hypothetical protein PHC34_06055 [Candidatus Gastranaerophilales bacterium]|nr:hypothetical protein [Candidatus Gastranaerophilales bacterium]